MVKFLVFFCLAITLCWADCSEKYPRPLDIVRPCNLHDYKCIGAYLAANSYCNKHVNGYLPSPLYLERVRYETPYFNSSYINTDINVSNFENCFVSEFFFNRRSKTAVISVDCFNLVMECDRQVLYHQSLKEDTYYNYHIRALYPLIRVTVNLPSSTHMDLCKARAFADVTALPKSHIDPKDQATANFLSKDLSRQNIFERESFYYRAFPIARIFINTFICDYNCYPFILE